MGGKGAEVSSRAARRRRKITLAGGETAPNPARGKDRRGTYPRETAEDTQKTALEARVRVFGATGSREDILAPRAASQVGYCVTALALRDDIPAVWQAWQSISTARRNYRTRILGVTGDAKCANIGMIPERMETDQSATIDVRSADERDQAAKRAWADWQARIAALPTPQMRWAIRAALDDGINPMAWTFWDGAPTAQGVVLVAALVNLMEVK